MKKFLRELFCLHIWAGIKVDSENRCTWDCCVRCYKLRNPDYWDKRTKEQTHE